MINAHFCLHFIRHYWSATRIDVLHSPFVFSLYNSCIKPKNRLADFEQVEQLRARLLKDKRILTQQDLGAGASAGPVKQKTVAQFTAQHAKPARIAQVIYRLVNHYRYSYLIELGTSLGISACYQASALKKNIPAEQANFTTIEGAIEIANVAAENFQQLGLSSYITQRTGHFDEVLPAVVNNYPQVDMAFIDGNHAYAPTLRYFNELLPKLHNNSMLIFDDIYWSSEMTKAWEEIKAHPRVTVTVDLFFIGLIFFRKEQAKEHFRLRIL